MKRLTIFSIALLLGLISIKSNPNDIFIVEDDDLIELHYG